MRKVTTQFTVKVILNVEDDAVMDDVLSDLDYDFKSLSDKVEVIHTEIESHEIIRNIPLDGN